MLKLAEAFIFNLMYISPEQDQKIRYTLRECGQEAYKLAAQPFEVSEKGPNDYVTSIDRYLDRQLSAAFSALFPEDGRITEENPPPEQLTGLITSASGASIPSTGLKNLFGENCTTLRWWGCCLRGNRWPAGSTPRLLTKCILAAKIGDCSKLWERWRRSRSRCANPRPRQRKIVKLFSETKTRKTTPGRSPKASPEPNFTRSAALA